MKKKVFYAMAASLALVSCADENIGFENQGINDGSMVAIEDVNLEFTREGNADSRAAWTPEMDFVWEKAAKDEIGLVYVGQSGKLGITNYEFTLDSLQVADFVKVSGSDARRCTGFYQLNEPLDDIKKLYKTKNGQGTAVELKEEDLASSASAKFKTDYDAIMKGYYVTYSPYNEEYTESGTAIPVTGVERLKVDKNTTNLQALGQATFSYSLPKEIAAGKQATQFVMKPLTNAFIINIANEAEYTSDKKLKSVVLRAKGDDKFVISGTLVNPGVEPSYANMVAGKKTSTLFVDYDVESYLTLNTGKKKAGEGVAEADTETLKAYFPVLPTSFAAGGFDVILIDSDNKACVLDVAFSGSGTVTTAAGTYYNFNVAVTKDTKFDQAFITDGKTLQDVIDKARTQNTTTTINLLGSIEATNLNVMNNDNDEADRNWKGGLVINGSAGSTLTLKTPNIKMWDNGDNPSDEEFKCESLTINAPLVVDGGDISGRVIVNDVTFKGNVDLGGYYTTYGHYSFMKITGDATVEKDAKLTVVYGRNYRPELYGFTGGLHVAEGASLTVKEGGELENQNLKFEGYTFRSDIVVDGALTVDAKAKFNNYGDTEVGETGKLVVNGTAKNYNNIEVKGGTFEVAGTLDNEEYKEEKTEEGANKGAQAPKIMIPSGKLELKSTGVISNKYSLNCAGTFVNSGAFYDYVGSVYGGSPFSSNGKYACYVDSQERLLEAVNRLNIYAADKYQEVILRSVESYDLDDIAEDKAAKLNIVNEGSVDLKFDANSNVKKASMTFNSLKVKGIKDEKITVTIKDNINFAGTTIAGTAVAPISIEEEATLKIANDITVKANGAIVNAGTFDLLNAENTSKIPATVYCTSADVSTGEWTNYPIITQSGNFWE